jgi:ABC-2 type transport system permease protein
MLLMYLTPIFYPDTIIPKYFMPIYRLNPLYHVIGFIRDILMYKEAPEPAAYLWCAVACLIPFLIGVQVFRKNEDKFVLNL